MKKRLAIITTHPIQYNAPLFALLSNRANIIIKVFYTWGEEVMQRKYDPGFGKNIEWDIPLLEGYDYSFVKNVANDKGSHHFKGIDNPGLINEIKDWRADSLLVFGWAFKSHLKVMRYFHGKIPVLFRGDSISKAKISFLKKQARNIFLSWVYRHIDFALYVGTHNKNYFKNLGLRDSQLLFAPHAVDNLRFESVLKRKMDLVENWKQSLGIDSTALVFLYAGKLDENKNVALLAKAFDNFNHPNTHLIIAGNGATQQELIDRYGSNPRLHFLPFQNQAQMPVLYGLAGVFVLPSRSETWGLSINEAMASGKPVLVSDTCGAAIDLVQNGVNGFTFRSGDEKDLKDKMLHFLEPERDLQKMGKASLEILKDWNYEKDCMAIESLFI